MVLRLSGLSSHSPWASFWRCVKRGGGWRSIQNRNLCQIHAHGRLHWNPNLQSVCEACGTEKFLTVVFSSPFECPLSPSLSLHWDSNAHTHRRTETCCHISAHAAILFQINGGVSWRGDNTHHSRSVRMSREHHLGRIREWLRSSRGRASGWASLSHSQTSAVLTQKQ